MLKILFVGIFTLMASAEVLDPVDDQIAVFKENTQGPIGILTTSAGAPVESKDAGSTLNSRLLLNNYFMDTLTHFVRERIPARAAHPKGAGAFGYFITTQDMSNITKADFLSEVGKVTPVAVRLSMALIERGGSDLARDARGFAVKFYTEQGNFDIAGFHIPVFAFKDPNFFATSVHATRKNPATDFVDVNMIWDFITLNPETFFAIMMLLSDRGIPDGYPNMPGFSIHTYPLYNENGILHYCRFNFKPVGGLKNLTSIEAAKLGAIDPDYNLRKLYKSISSGNYPTWDVRIQLMSEEFVKNNAYVFDVSKLIPESEVPWITIGQLVLNRAPRNFFAEVEQLAFCPANLVPGILAAPDKTFEARSFSYRDSERYRLGTNFDKIRVNYPYRSKVFTYTRDGRAPVRDNENDTPNYYPNSFHGSIPYMDCNRPPIPIIYEEEADNFEQMSDYYTNEMLDDERARFADNIVFFLCGAINSLQEKALKLFNKVHCDLADRVREGLEKNNCIDGCIQ